jgi:hypothetical protein
MEVVPATPRGTLGPSLTGPGRLPVHPVLGQVQGAGSVKPVGGPWLSRGGRICIASTCFGMGFTVSAPAKPTLSPVNTAQPIGPTHK